jgi:hypothetical protein
VSGLLQIDLVLGIVAIIVAAVIIVRRGRRTRPPARSGEVAGLADGETAQGETPVVPGFSDGAAGPDFSRNGLHRAAYEPEPAARRSGPTTHEPGRATHLPGPAAREPGPGAREPAGPEQEASSQVSVITDAEPGAREPAGPEQEASSQVSDVAATEPGPNTPAAEPDGQPGADGTATSSGRVYNYYEGADQPIADYLTEVGWAEEPGAAGPR